METVPTPSFGFPVQWLRVGERQLHLFERPGLAPAYHHVGLTVDEVEPIYARAKEQGCLDSSTFAGHLLELPGDCVQLYLRDPAGNPVEVNTPGASRLPDWIKADMVKLADIEPQNEENLRARLFLVEEPPAVRGAGQPWNGPDDLRGQLLAIGAGVSFGTLGMFSKLFYEHGGHPFELLVMRFVGTAALLWLLVGWRRRWIGDRRATLIGLCLGLLQIGASYSLLEGFDRAPAGLVVLLFYVYPLLVTVGGALLFGEELGTRRAVVLALGTAGIALTVGTPSSTPAIGIALGLAAGVFLAGSILGARHAMTRGGGLEPFETIALMYTGPAIAFSIATAVHGFPRRPQPGSATRPESW